MIYFIIYGVLLLLSAWLTSAVCLNYLRAVSYVNSTNTRLLANGHRLHEQSSGYKRLRPTSSSSSFICLQCITMSNNEKTVGRHSKATTRVALITARKKTKPRQCNTCLEVEISAHCDYLFKLRLSKFLTYLLTYLPRVYCIQFFIIIVYSFDKRLTDRNPDGTSW